MPCRSLKNRRVITALTGLACLVLACAGGPKRFEEVEIEDDFQSPQFWAEAEERYGDYGGFYHKAERRILYEYEYPTLSVRETNHSQIVVLDSDMMEGYANVAIPYYPGTRVENIRAKTITPNGTELHVSDADIFEKPYMPDYKLFSDTKRKIFAMPGFADHCVLDISYDVVEERYQAVDSYMMARKIPVRLASYKYTVSTKLYQAGKSVYYKTYNFSQEPVRERTENRYETYSWQLEDVPAYPDEERMPPREEVVPRVFISGYKADRTVSDRKKDDTRPMQDDWDHFGYSWNWWARWYNSMMPDFNELPQHIREHVAGLTREVEGTERIQKVLDSVGEDIRYVSISIGESGYVPLTPVQVFENKYGDCKGMSVLTIAMLRQLGIKAYPALVRTKNEGSVDSTFIDTRFNHMIVYVEDGDLWLDPTVAPCPVDYLPSSERGLDALVIRGSQGIWKRTPSTTPHPSLRSSRSSLHLDQQGEIEGSTTVKYEGDTALSRFRQFRGLNRSETREAAEEIVKRYVPGAVIDSCRLERLGHCPLRVDVSADYGKPASASILGDRMVVRLDFPKLALVHLAEGLSTTGERRYPLWLPYSLAESDTVLLEIPPGWEVESLPGDTEAQTPYGSYRFVYSAGDSVVILREARLPVDTIPREEVTSFVEFWVEAGLKAGEEIILVARTP